jgi:endonuclease/exonuclease/phosphatase family metal-dependent hydrolase
MIRVISYNIRTGIGMDVNYRLDRIIDTLRGYRGDLIALQEVDVCWGERTHFDDQVRLLASSLQMESFFAPIYSFGPRSPGAPPRQYGLAVLSKFPFKAQQNRLMLRLSTQDPNPVPKPMPGFADVTIEVEGHALRLLNVQLDYRSNPRIRELQVADILQATPAPVRHTLLVGDFNAEPNAAELEPLYQQWTDAWATLGQGAGLTFPADKPVKRIDGILLSAGLSVQQMIVGDAQASDHLPLVANIALD